MQTTHSIDTISSGRHDTWRAFKVRTHCDEKINLGNYDLVRVVCDSSGIPKKLTTDWAPQGFYAAFNDEKKISDNLLSEHFTTFMLGTLMKNLRQDKSPTAVVINPDFAHNNWQFEEVLWAPLCDGLTDKLMMTPPEEALALLAIDSKDQERFGIKLVFHMISNIGAPDEQEARDQFLKNKIEELAYYAPRVPMNYGSASIYCVLLNLENTMEEYAFIRNYQTFDPHSDVLFVTSGLELLTGELKSIPYKGDVIDTIFLPIIEWQHRYNQTRMQFNSTLEMERFLN